MIIDEIESYYKKELPEETKKWISENFRNLGEENENNIKQCLFESSSKLPDIQKLKTVLEKVTGKKARQFIWAVCLECGCEYDYSLPMCPGCYDKGFDCRARAVKKSEFQPPMKVVKYNKQYQHGDKNETVCYDCVHKSGSFCIHYGNPNWNCQREEFESCKCARCCAMAKRINAELEKNKAQNKTSYAIPLKRG